jgi:hypothetical protein
MPEALYNNVITEITSKLAAGQTLGTDATTGLPMLAATCPTTYTDMMFTFIT